MSSSVRVLGVGIGTFLIATVLIAWVLAAAVAFVTRTQAVTHSVFAAVFVILVLILALSPRSSNVVTNAALARYSTYYPTLAIVAGVLFVFAAVALIGAAVFALPRSRHVRVVES